MGPLIYLTNQKDFTLALGLQFFQSQLGGTEWHYLTAASTLVQLLAATGVEGRILSLYLLGVVGTTPLGSLLSGWLAPRIPAPLAVSLTAAVILVFLAYVLLTQPAWRHIEPSA